MEKLSQVNTDNLNEKPYVILSAATSLNGYLATSKGDSQLSNSEDWVRVHLLRMHSDAIMVGSGTIRTDDSKLTVNETIIGKKVDKHPLRVVVSSKGDIPLNSRVITYRPDIPTLIVVTSLCSPEKRSLLEKKGCLTIECGNGPLVDLQLLLKLLRRRYKVRTLMVEGGSTLNGELLNHHLIDEVQIALAPVICGEGIPLFSNQGRISKFSDSPFFEIIAFNQIDDMMWIKMLVHYHQR